MFLSTVAHSQNDTPGYVVEKETKDLIIKINTIVLTVKMIHICFSQYLFNCGMQTTF